MAKFSAFDDEFEASATMAVLAGVEEFEKSVRSVAKSLNIVVRVPWAHPIFRVWTEDKYNECFWIMELLVKRFFQSEDQKDILVQLEFGKLKVSLKTLLAVFSYGRGVLLILSDNNNNRTTIIMIVIVIFIKATNIEIYWFTEGSSY